MLTSTPALYVFEAQIFKAQKLIQMNRTLFFYHSPLTIYLPDLLIGNSDGKREHGSEDDRDIFVPRPFSFHHIFSEQGGTHTQLSSRERNSGFLPSIGESQVCDVHEPSIVIVSRPTVWRLASLNQKAIVIGRADSWCFTYKVNSCRPLRTGTSEAGAMSPHEMCAA